jgi:hypothetical protein
MFGALAKTYYAQKTGRKPGDIVVVSVMPCTAKKFEAQRPEMNAGGGQDVDAVLTTRELGRMITQAGIDFLALPDETMDQPLGISSGAADIFANTGGVMEAALRTVWCVVTGRPFPFEKLHVAPIAGLAGVKEVAITIPDTVPEWKFLKGQTLNLAALPFYRSDVLPGRLHRRRRPAPLHHQRGAPGAHEGHFCRRRGQTAALVA